MTHPRRSCHAKRKAPAGAYSDRFGNRLGRDRPAASVETAAPSLSVGPMLHGMPLSGLLSAIKVNIGTDARR